MRRILAGALGAALVSVSLCGSAAAAPRACSMVLRLTDAVALGSLDLTVNYAAANGTFAVDQFDQIRCVNEVLTAAAVFDDNQTTHKLEVGYISIAGFSGPTTIARCEFDDADGSLVPEDFVVTVNDAAAPDGAPLAGLPTVVLRLPDCAPSETSTTTTTTPVSTTEEPVPFCDITLRMTSATTIGSLNWNLGYETAPGEFAGSGGNVACTNLRPGALALFNDIEAQRALRGGLIKLTGFTAPADIARCRFLPTTRDVPIASDFALTVVQASDKDNLPLDPLPKMQISSIECYDPTSTTSTTVPACGDGVVQGDEACDDGNLVSRDGCSSDCTVDTICGDADLNGALTAADALTILKAAVGDTIECPMFVCDTDDSGTILADDALSALRRAVGTEVLLDCPPEP